MKIHATLAALGLAAGLFAISAPAHALTQTGCSTKWASAKDQKVVPEGMKWNDFRKAECGSDADPVKFSTLKGSSSGSKAAKKTAKKKTTKKAAASTESVKGITQKECSAKWAAAKDGGVVPGDMKWNDFRKAECGPGSDPVKYATLGAPAATTAAITDGDLAPKKSKKSEKGLTQKVCSAKWASAKEQGVVPEGMKWNDFRKAECGPGADEERLTSLDSAEPAADTAPTTVAPRGVRFPSKVSTKYKDLSPGKARQKTCLDGYYANKEADALNGLRWIQKGGGYYSLCNNRLKG